MQNVHGFATAAATLTVQYHSTNSAKKFYLVVNQQHKKRASPCSHDLRGRKASKQTSNFFLATDNHFRRLLPAPSSPRRRPRLRCRPPRHGPRLGHAPRAPHIHHPWNDDDVPVVPNPRPPREYRAHERPPDTQVHVVHAVHNGAHPRKLQQGVRPYPHQRQRANTLYLSPGEADPAGHARPRRPVGRQGGQ